jgi:hypothetical protein
MTATVKQILQKNWKNYLKNYEVTAYQSKEIEK